MVRPMFAHVRHSRSPWAMLALCLALLMGLGHVAHFWSHMDGDPRGATLHNHAALHVDDIAAMVGGDIAVGLHGCEHQHDHDGDSAVPVATSLLTHAPDALPVSFAEAPVVYDAHAHMHVAQTGRDGPDRPPRAAASA